MGADSIPVNPWMMLPFGILLASIALGPLLFPAWWNRQYPKVAYFLGAIVVCYYFVGLRQPARVWDAIHEYVSFIALIGSLFVVAGGIHISVKGEATPLANVIFLLAGALAANILGTTGASMLLIRPWLRMNHYRITGHHVVFFIFIVSNVGGCLTPIGDPPLFLGYLAGIPFWWVTTHCLPVWAVGVSLLLVMFFVVDYRNYTRAPKQVRSEQTSHHDAWKFAGLRNLLFLPIILVAVFIDHPAFLREALMLAAAAGSYLLTHKSVHESNHFNFHPIQEVAVLFIGIFATMMPALDWLQSNAHTLQQTTPGVFYWSCGGLSSALDNAPTYLCFLKAMFGRFVDRDVATQVAALVQSHGANLSGLIGTHTEDVRQTYATLQKYYAPELTRGVVSTDQIETAFLLGHLKFNAYLVAISVASVFFGANTYIGNGPNFMVKSIADQQKVSTPGFPEYIFRYTLPFMLPVLAIVWWIFFRE
ncbi:MAG TPA: sodium:proton antiporter [Verrucomicrobiae bacterium]|nr:sodium:proton antiporter [Verrucomicrobiae bacterium]